ncbi:hypothetical protein QR98_0036250 [Sarcoptes scabiei]|uniref:Uncharacterized protein n=1 Tax=Sarcoptes scabiei TaxID=52283 RepID=A0A132A2B0_SARSC|nr:hypothetical protein QR98_0036250 [Sarcoptes scabiei]
MVNSNIIIKFLRWLTWCRETKRFYSPLLIDRFEKQSLCFGSDHIEKKKQIHKMQSENYFTEAANNLRENTECPFLTPFSLLKTHGDEKIE